MSDTQDIIRFYRGEAGNIAGDTLEEMWCWTDGALEMNHDYVQWMFPSNEPSQMNCDAPVLSMREAIIFQADPELQARVLVSFDRILDFFGFARTGGRIEALEATADNINPQKAISFFNHNMLRVTRILKSLRLTGHEEMAQAWFEALQPWKSRLSANTWGYWEAAAKGPL